MNHRTLNIIYISISTALITVCSWISIPLTIPFTLQTFAIFLILFLLGGKRGLASICIYILLCSVGIPVLSGFKGGVGALMGVTGGYVIGFIFIAATYILAETFSQNNKIVKILAVIIGLLLCYLFGTLWFMNVYNKSGTSASFMYVLSVCVFPFIIPDLVKLSIAYFLGAKLKQILKINTEV